MQLDPHRRGTGKSLGERDRVPLQILVLLRRIEFVTEFHISLPAPQSGYCGVIVTPRGCLVRPSQISLDLVENGGSADSPTANHQTCGACRIEAGDGRGGIDDIAVRDDWDVNGLDDLANLLPIGYTGVPLSQGSAVKYKVIEIIQK